MKGKIKKIIEGRGFGFILLEDGSDIFFHRTALIDVDINDLRYGDLVTFETESSEKGLRAIKVTKS